MYAYCNNNPVRYIDPQGTELLDTEEVDEGFDPKDESRYGRGSRGGDSSSVGYNGGKVGAAPQKVEVHHVVERCQGYKTGFSKEQIEAQSNKVELDYYTHRAISGYYSSKFEFANGLRVRDWLAGKPFEEQTRFGWYIIQIFRGY